MNTIQLVSIFICGFALGLILFIVLEKFFEPEVDFELDELYMAQDKSRKPTKNNLSQTRLSAKQNYIDDSLGLSYTHDYNNEKTFTKNLKTKVIELRNRNKVAF